MTTMSNLRPRLCAMEKGASGYGFHLHGEKAKSGQFVRLVEPDTPASDAGLLAGDRLMFVNGDSVEGESHQHVVAKIRATVGRLELIVVDADTAELLQKHNLKCQKEFVTEGIPVPGDDSDSDRGDSHSHGSSSRRGSSPAPRENGDASSDRLSVSSKVRRTPVRLHCTARRRMVFFLLFQGGKTSESYNNNLLSLFKCRLSFKRVLYNFRVKGQPSLRFRGQSRVC